MDIEDLYTQQDHDKGAEINILHPVTEEPTDIFIKVVGVDSKRWRKGKAEVAKKLGKMKAEEIQDYDMDSLSSECLAAATIGWRGVEKKGKEIEFSESECAKLYQFSPFVYHQVNEFIAKRVNFTKG